MMPEESMARAGAPESRFGRLPGIAVVGAGYWGPNVIRNFFDNPQCRLLAICDKDAGRRDQMAAIYRDRVALVERYDTLLSDPDVEGIVIVTDVPTHKALVEQALLAGKHVFVEKPLATTAAECLALAELAQRQGKTLMVGHTFIYNPAVTQLKEIFDSGLLGEIYYLHAQRLNLGRIQTHTNALWSLAVHDVSIALYLFEELPVWVRAWGHAFITPGVEDVAFLNMQFPSGRLAHIHVSWLDPEKKRQLTVVGSQKMAVYDDVSMDRKITLYDKGIDKALKDVDNEFREFSEFQYLIRSGDVHIPHLSFTEPLKIETQHFIDCVTGRCPQPKTGWKEGYEVVRVLEAAQESLYLSGIPVEIDWQAAPVPIHLSPT